MEYAKPLFIGVCAPVRCMAISYKEKLASKVAINTKLA
jgi:hypothetical protein